jgi:hypothetical protein
MRKNSFTFEVFVSSIQLVHDQLAAQVSRAVNVSLTLRNWMIGRYIAEFELLGADRANYGDRLFSILAKRLTGLRISNCNRRQLYPGIVGTLSPQMRKLLLPEPEIAILSLETAAREI